MTVNAFTLVAFLARPQMACVAFKIRLKASEQKV